MKDTRSLLYLQNLRFIKSRVFFYYKKFNKAIDFETLEGKANEIFCNCLNDYDKNKNDNFTKYLGMMLNYKLIIYCKIIINEISRTFSLEESIVSQRYCPFSYIYLEDSIETELSPLAQKVIKGILDGTYLTVYKNRKLFSQNTIREKLKLTWDTTSIINQEITRWWNKFEKETSTYS